VSGGTDPTAGKSVWGSGFLPSVHQGVQCRSGPEPIFYVSDPPGMDRTMRRQGLDALNRLNSMELARGNDPETRTRIEQYELAYRMQASVPEVMDISREPATILREYGATVGQGGFAANCLLARRMVEQGVRYVQLFDWGWDTHGTGPGDDIVNHLPKKCKEVDQPIAALLRDLDRRGMLDSTLVVWGGEFGRTPTSENGNGRDHNHHGFTMWLAGGGVKGGMTYGETDEFGFKAATNKVHVHDLHATILHLLGLDHERLTFRHAGRDFRLTDVYGNVVRDIIA